MTGKNSHPDGTQICKESRYLRGVVVEKNIFPSKVRSKVHQVVQDPDISFPLRRDNRYSGTVTIGLEKVEAVGLTYYM